MPPHQDSDFNTSNFLYYPSRPQLYGRGTKTQRNSKYHLFVENFPLLSTSRSFDLLHYSNTQMSIHLGRPSRKQKTFWIPFCSGSKSQFYLRIWTKLVQALQSSRCFSHQNRLWFRDLKDLHRCLSTFLEKVSKLLSSRKVKSGSCASRQPSMSTVKWSKSKN